MPEVTTEECRLQTIDWRSRAERVMTEKMRTTNQSLRELKYKQRRGRQELGIQTTFRVRFVPRTT